jgi:ABC-type glycerol-3-phosphate transport system substrate-binding protein
MFSSKMKRLMIGAASSTILISSWVPTHADDEGHGKKTNINLSVASNFYGVPPSNSAITDLINSFEAANPKYTVTVVDNGATATLANHIINGNMLKADLFLGSRHRYSAGLAYQSF